MMLTNDNPMPVFWLHASAVKAVNSTKSETKNNLDDNQQYRVDCTLDVFQTTKASFSPRPGKLRLQGFQAV
jgi:hypothetical protein